MRCFALIKAMQLASVTLRSRPLAYLVLLIGGWLVLLAELFAFMSYSLESLAQTTRGFGVIIIVWATADDWADFKIRMRSIAETAALHETWSWQHGLDGSAGLPASSLTAHGYDDLTSFSGEGSRTDVGSAMRSPPHEKRSFETVDASEPSSVASNSSPCSDIYCNSRSSSSVDEAELNPSTPPSTPPSNRVRTGDGDQYSGPYHSPYRPYMEPLEGVAVSTTLVPSAEPPRVNREIDISNRTQSNGTGSALGESFLIQREKPSTQAAGGMELAGLLGMARRADEEESRTPREKGVSRVVAELSPWRHDGTADDDDETLSSQHAPE